MPIQNVNATNNSYQVAAADAQQNQQPNPADVQNAENITNDGDTLTISPEAEKLQSENLTENTEIQGEGEVNQPDQNAGGGAANNIQTEPLETAIPEKQPDETVGERGIRENRTEDIQRQNQVKENATNERNTQNQNPSLDLTV